jgi:hypothetical protein
MKKAKRKFLKEGSSPNVVEKDYDDGGAFDENKKINEENIAEAKKLMKTGKMAPQPEGDSPKIKMRCGKMASQSEGDSSKIKMRCGKKDGGLVKQGKPKLAKKGWR